MLNYASHITETRQSLLSLDSYIMGTAGTCVISAAVLVLSKPCWFILFA